MIVDLGWRGRISGWQYPLIRMGGFQRWMRDNIAAGNLPMDAKEADYADHYIKDIFTKYQLGIGRCQW